MLRSCSLLLSLVSPPLHAQLVEKLSAPLARDAEGSGGDVFSHALTPNGARILFAGDVQTDGDGQLWSVPFVGGPIRQLSARTTPMETFFEFRSVPGTDKVVYWNDETTAQVYELHVVKSDGSAPPLRLHPPLPAGRGAGFDFEFAGPWVLYRADALVDDQFELFRMPLDAGAPPLRLSAPMVAGGSIGFIENQRGVLAVTPAGDHALYLADALTDGRNELFSVPVDASVAAVRLNGNLPSGAHVRLFRITPDGARVVYLADQAIVGRIELYSAPVDGSTPAVRLSATPVAGGGVWPELPLVTSDGAWVVYRADALSNDEIELFVVPSDGSAAPLRLNTPMAHAGWVGGVKLARDDARVVYSADQEVDERYELWSVPLDGRAAPVRVLGAAFSGVGGQAPLDVSATRVLCQADRDGNGRIELYSVPIDASAPPVELSAPALATSTMLRATLSPDGTRVAFVADRESLGRYELWGVPFDGSAPPVRLSPHIAYRGQALAPLFRADGRVAFLADAPVQNQFALWSTDGTTLRALTPDLPAAPVVGDVSAFAWSADGEHVLYGANRAAPGGWSATSLRLADRHESYTPAGSPVSGFLLPPRSARFAYTTFFIGEEFPYPTAESLWSAPLDDATQAVLVAGSTDVGAVRFTADEYALVALSNSGYRIDPLGRLVLAPLDGSSAARDLATPTGRPSYVWPLEHAPRAGRALFGLFDPNASENGLFAADLAGGAPVPLGSPQHALSTVTGLALRAADELALFVSDQAAGGRQELFAVPADGSRALRRLHPALPLGADVGGAFRVSPDGARVVFRADAELDEVFELYVTRVADGVVTKLSGTMVAGGDVALPFENEASFWISPDGARVVFLADRELDGVTELWSVPLDGSATPVRLHAPLADTRDAVGAARFTPNGARVVFAAELAAEGVFELLSAPADGGGPTLVLSAPFPPGGGLVASDSLGTFGSVALAPGGRHAFYLAEQEQDGVVELYSAPVDASHAPLKRNAALVAGGDVTTFAVGPTPGAVLYRADQDEDEVFELYLSAFPAAPPPRQRSATPGASVTRTVDLP
jgi:Tol biopolymer transport system component